MLESINVRFFCVAYVSDVELQDSGYAVETFEITERCFNDLAGQAGGVAPIQYERHSVFENGCRQVCLTLDLDDWPHDCDLDIVT